ncbi:DUF4129 domain-containing protein [Deinococcus apachensis]|uniref:DUF4129 domain-containing protein n=1 Tax=Deinococcus apachensis TaxID=309886 RepID=UPI000372B4B0|nr:DUF4129 domain-containing protein [Deinococcus apachensis]
MALSPTSPRPAPFWADRSLLLLAAPLVGVAWLPWWAMLGLPVALALTRRGDGPRSVRVPLLLLGAGVGLVGSLPGMRGPEGAVAFIQAFVTVMGGTALVYLGVSALEERRVGWGAGWLAALLLLGAVVPGGGSVVGLALGLLALLLTLLGAAGVEERPHRRLAGGGKALLGTAGAALAAALLLALLAFALPGSGTGRLGQPGNSPAAPAQAQESPAVPPLAQPPTAQRQGEVRRVRPVGNLPDRLPGGDLVLLSGLLFFAALAFAMWRARSREPGEPFRFQWWEVAAVMGVGLTAALLLAFSFAARTGAGGDLGPGASAGAAGTLDTQALREVSDPLQLFWERSLWVLSLLAFLVFTGLAAALFWLGLRFRPDPAEAEPEETLPSTPYPGEEEALHRVRLAYRAALTSLAAVGLGRGEAETPAEHAGRVTGVRPALAGPLGTLVAAYAPVRYGGRVTEDDADAAERAAREVTHLTAQTDRKDTESETT